MRRTLRRFRSIYGAGPLHMVALAASLVVIAAAIVRWFDPGSDGTNIALWFAGGLVAHDFVLLPLYSVLDRLAQRARSRPHHHKGRVAYLRVPAILSVLLLGVSLPSILGLGQDSFHTATGHYHQGYLARWLLSTAALFLVSALAYAVHRVRRSRSVMESAGDRA